MHACEYVDTIDDVILSKQACELVKHDILLLFISISLKKKKKQMKRERPKMDGILALVAY